MKGSVLRRHSPIHSPLVSFFDHFLILPPYCHVWGHVCEGRNCRQQLLEGTQSEDNKT